MVGRGDLFKVRTLRLTKKLEGQAKGEPRWPVIRSLEAKYADTRKE